MNVTKDNLEQIAAEIESLLPTAAFVAIDEEMTGITLQGQAEQVQDLPAKRYLKMRNVASRYSIIQFGLCLFHESEPESGGAGHYVARPYNFYVFPETGTLTLDGSAVNFLRTHKMDFNKWVYDGVPFQNKEGAKKLRCSLFPGEQEQKQAENADAEKRQPIVLNRKYDIEVTDKALAGIREWLADEARKDETEYEVINTNGYLRRFLYEAVAKEFPQLVAESRQVPGGMRGKATFVVLRLNEEQRAQQSAKAREEKEKEYRQKIGFLRIYQALSDSKKPLVGHNCMYDLLFMSAHFEAALPKSYETFREVLQNRFPTILDTKLLATREPFKFKPQAAAPGEAGQPPAQPEGRFGSTALEEVFKVFREEARLAKEAGKPTVEVTFAPAFDRYDNDVSAAHEAGYDAYMTGYAFAHMAKEALKPEVIAATGNRLPIFRSIYEFNLAGGDESKLQGAAYLHMSGLTGWGVEDVRGAFKEIKAPGSEEPVHVQIHWIDDDSAFVVFPEACKEALDRKLEKSRSDGSFWYTDGQQWFAEQAGCEVWGAEEAAEGPPQKRART